MDSLTPDFLLANPELVRPAAPWCVALENLELAMLLLSLPWIAGDGFRRADLERQLAGLGPDMPVGPVYFQRVRRAAAVLESAGALLGRGKGRGRRFTATPEGFAALILNLRTLRSDPTVDGSEFEFKRALVAMWNVVAERVVELPADMPWAPDADRFFDRVERVALWDRQVITDAVMCEAFDVLRLVELQRERVRSLRQAAAQVLGQAEARATLLRDAPLGPFAAGPTGEDLGGHARQVLETVRALASHAIPALRARSTLVRYDAYLAYLDALTELYARELKVVDLGRLRAVVHGRSA